jgi:endonuclease IV
VADHLPLLKLVHFNDSHGACDSCVDRHAFIGTGHIGIDIMTKIATLCVEKGIDMVIE